MMLILTMIFSTDDMDDDNISISCWPAKRILIIRNVSLSLIDPQNGLVYDSIMILFEQSFLLHEISQRDESSMNKTNGIDDSNVHIFRATITTSAMSKWMLNYQILILDIGFIYET